VATDKFNHDRAAQVLAEAAIYGDAKAATRASITVRTIQNYRKRLAVDTLLSQLFAEKRAALERKWASSLAPAIRSAVGFLQRAAEEADPRDPEAIHAVAGAFKLLTEVAITKEILDERFAERRAQAEPVRQMDAPGTPALNN
jgi:uncharacterized protein (DUF2267 family)